MLEERETWSSDDPLLFYLLTKVILLGSKTKDGPDTGNLREIFVVEPLKEFEIEFGGRYPRERIKYTKDRSRRVRILPSLTLRNFYVYEKVLPLVWKDFFFFFFVRTREYNFN